MKRSLICWALLVLGATTTPILCSNAAEGSSSEKRLLYVATPGIRSYLEYGGHGILVFDIDQGHRFVKRIPGAGLDAKGAPSNVKGVCVSTSLKRIYVSTLKTMYAVDLVTEKVLWEKTYEGGCDRMSISPDGMVIYLPSLEGDHWHVVNAETGGVIAKIIPKSGAHNTVYGSDGAYAYLAGLRSPFLSVSDTSKHEVTRTVGPFSASIRPFTVNGLQTLCYVNVNGLLGFEVGDIRSGKKLHSVEVEGFEKGPTKRHGCPSHGIGLTPDEKEVWIADAHNSRLHVFNNTVLPPKQVASILLKDEPGWVTFTSDGQFAYPSTGDVIDVRTKKIVTSLKDEKGAGVQSEKLLEIDFRGKEPIRSGDQFGVGRVGPKR